jgi:Matrixin
MSILLKPVKLALCVGCLFCLAAVPMRSEGPLLVGGPSQGSLVQAEGVPYKWSATSLAFNSGTETLSYWTDQGSLGSVSNPDNLVAQAFSAWQNVPTASIKFTQAGKLSQDVTLSNYKTVLNALQNCGASPATTAPSGGAQPVTVIFDTDGSILNDMGEDPNTIGGEATALCPSSDGKSNTYNRGEAILNGKKSDTSLLTAVMTHEFGHLIGFDHAQINLDCLSNTQACADDGSLAGVPIMFPVLLRNPNTGTYPTTPRTDDVAAVSVLYPETANNAPAQIPFSTLGRIQGRVFFSDGMTPAQGYNVIARCVSCASGPRVVAVSNVSGYLFTENAGNTAVPTSLSAEPYFSHDPALLGFFDLPGLPPGTYTVEVEAIHNSSPFPFVQGSSVGPIGILGFQFTLPGTCATHQFFDNPPPGADPCTSGTTLTVPPSSAGVTTGIDIVLTGTGPRFDAWEDRP